jgi:uncharacterized membrane protein YkoI
MWKRPAVALMLAGGVLSAAGAQTYDDYERAREAVARGEVLPLTDILPRVESEYGGRMIEVEFNIEETGYAYEFELIQPDGRIIEVTVDAATGKMLSYEVEDG